MGKTLEVVVFNCLAVLIMTAFVVVILCILAWPVIKFLAVWKFLMQ